MAEFGTEAGFQEWVMLHNFLYGSPVKKWITVDSYIDTFDQWDNLIALVQKIAQTFGEWDYEDERRVKAEDIFYMDNMFSEFLQNDLDAIRVRCVEFVKWFNTLKD